MQKEHADKDFVRNFARHLTEDGKGPKIALSCAGDAARFLAWLEGMGTRFSGDLRRFQVTGYQFGSGLPFPLPLPLPFPFIFFCRSAR